MPSFDTSGCSHPPPTFVRRQSRRATKSSRAAVAQRSAEALARLLRREPARGAASRRHVEVALTGGGVHRTRLTRSRRQSDSSVPAQHGHAHRSGRCLAGSNLGQRCHSRRQARVPFDLGETKGGPRSGPPHQCCGTWALSRGWWGSRSRSRAQHAADAALGPVGAWIERPARNSLAGQRHRASSR